MPEPIMHLPQPGPAYWNWRCLRCGESVDRHASWWRLLVARLRKSGDSGQQASKPEKPSTRKEPR